MAYVGLIVEGIFSQLLATTLSLQLESNTRVCRACVCLEERQLEQHRLLGNQHSLGTQESLLRR